MYISSSHFLSLIIVCFDVPQEVSANWSCILYDYHIVIHCEKPEAAHQYFYPFSLLRSHSAYLPTRNSYPLLTGLVKPARTLTKEFVFPRIAPQGLSAGSVPSREEEMMWLSTVAPHMVLMLPSISPPQNIGTTQLVPIPPTAANTGAISSGVSLVASSSLGVMSGPIMASQTPIFPPPLNQPLAVNPFSALGSTMTSVPTPGAPLIPHASLPPQSPSFFLHNTDSYIPSPAQTQLPNPFPFPTWYPESAHFVRQWWPTLPGIPRVSCTVVLLVMHDQETHRNRFVLAQHYFKVPIDWGMWIHGEGSSTTTVTSSNSTTAGTKLETREGDDELMKMWYVSKPFEVVRVFDERDDDENAMMERPRPLVAVDFGHAVWIEYDDEAVPPPNRPIAVHTLSHRHDTAPDSPAMMSSIMPPDNGTENHIHVHVDGLENGTGIAIPFGSGHDGHDPISHGEVPTSIPGLSTLPPNGMPYEIVHDENYDREPEPEVDPEPKVLKFVTFPGYEGGFEEEWIEEEIEVEAEIGEIGEPETDVLFSTTTKGGKGKQRANVDEELANGLGQQQQSKSRNKGKGKEKSRTSIYVNGLSSTSTSCINGSHPKIPMSKPTTTLKKVRRRRRRNRETEGVVRTLEVPDELDLGLVETINIDQSQGAVILSDRDGKIFILCYE